MNTLTARKGESANFKYSFIFHSHTMSVSLYPKHAPLIHSVKLLVPPPMPLQSMPPKPPPMQ